ncbi:hypothetical protein [Sinimarinibacterium sp. CAU 1509]|uniref:hypothetical protein n=1 Tax=Sinimarinibacterium sp. CAU 1509 TaxID=2562283 RepID=UPI00146E7852|nr:hypothetical protein [Sinimarinibacterium sp. CAU 1509]
MRLLVSIDNGGTPGGRNLDAGASAEEPQAAGAIYTRIPESLSPDTALGWLGRLRGE